MSAPRREPLPRMRLIDAVWLVAATAPPLALARWMVASDGKTTLLTPALWWSFAAFDRFAGVPYKAHYGAALMTPFLASWLVALLLIVSFRPLSRRERSRSLRRPGVTPSLALVGLAAIEIASWALLDLPWKLRPPVPRGVTIIRPLTDPSQLYHVGCWTVGASIALIWSLMAISGTWRPERSWTDRLGRFLGALWIATTPLHLWASTLTM